VNLPAARRLSLALAAAATAAAVAAGTAAVVAVRGRLPDPVAVHWGAAGVADGFQPVSPWRATPP
jgi:hypothetical protein